MIIMASASGTLVPAIARLVAADEDTVRPERLRQILHARGISFQRTRTWKESHDPGKDAKLDRIEYVTSRYADRSVAFDQFGPLSIRPCHGACWAPRKRPARLRATYHRTRPRRSGAGRSGRTPDCASRRPVPAPGAPAAYLDIFTRMLRAGRCAQSFCGCTAVRDAVNLRHGGELAEFPVSLEATFGVAKPKPAAPPARASPRRGRSGRPRRRSVG